MDKECINYKPNILNILLPTFEFVSICKKHQNTKLLIVYFMRFLIYNWIFIILKSKNIKGLTYKLIENYLVVTMLFTVFGIMYRLYNINRQPE